MNKHILPAFALILVLLPLTSCDFFRHLAGRPDSAAIAEKREYVESEKLAFAQAEQKKRDSLALVLKNMADSTSAIDSLKNEKVLSVERVGGLKEGEFKRYYVILGSFSNKANAQRLSLELLNKGYQPEIIPFKNGYSAVGIAGTDNVVEIQKALTQIRRQDFCPQGVWILENK